MVLKTLEIHPNFSPEAALSKLPGQSKARVSQVFFIEPLMDHGYHSYVKLPEGSRGYKQQHHVGLLMEYAMLGNSICSKMGKKTNQHVSFQNPACLVKSDTWCMVYHGWWFQTSILFSIIYGYIWDVILPIDELHHFSEGWLNHQAVYHGLSISSGLTQTWIWLISPLDHPDIGIPE